MTRAQSEDVWTRTASLMALIANCNRDPKRRSKAFTPNDFNPYAPPPPVKTKEEVKKRVKELRDSWLPPSRKEIES